VLVFHDLLGIHKGHIPKFVKRYADVGDAMTAGVRAFADEVRSGKFPDPEHTYSVEPEELAEFEHYLEQDSLASVSAWDW
jgi:3-methyl-2-oxobutanoate hydroxymethyltransferase